MSFSPYSFKQDFDIDIIIVVLMTREVCVCVWVLTTECGPGSTAELLTQHTHSTHTHTQRWHCLCSSCIHIHLHEHTHMLKLSDFQKRWFHNWTVLCVWVCVCVLPETVRWRWHCGWRVPSPHLSAQQGKLCGGPYFLSGCEKKRKILKTFKNYFQ